MTDNATAQITDTAAGGQDYADAERPAAPVGSVYLSDVLARVRRHALTNSWCGTAENATMQALNEELSFKPVRSQRCTCASCGPADAAETMADERFIPVEGTDPFVTKVRLKKAIRRAVDLCYDWDEPMSLYRELIDAYGLDEVSLPVITYTVTFTVTDEQLHGRSADRSGILYALQSGSDVGFAVSAESAEQATATLVP
ncbi:hypothetical protein ACFY36_50660 [Actinoplanes sp. NPDC000266]